MITAEGFDELERDPRAQAAWLEERIDAAVGAGEILSCQLMPEAVEAAVEQLAGMYPHATPGDAERVREVAAGAGWGVATVSPRWWASGYAIEPGPIEDRAHGEAAWYDDGRGLVATDWIVEALTMIPDMPPSVMMELLPTRTVDLSDPDWVAIALCVVMNVTEQGGEWPTARDDTPPGVVN